jgi:hypothetical protein
MESNKFKQNDEHLRMLDKWYWRSVFSQYYISATETKIQRTVRQWISREGEREGWLDNRNNEPDSVSNFSYRTSILEDVSRVDNAIYRGVISLLLSRNISDFGRNRRNLGAVPWEEMEDHHIYPKQFLRPYGIRGERVNNIANRTLLTRTTNQEIRNTAPRVYLTDTKIVGPNPVDPTVVGHLIDPSIILKPFMAEVYNEFLTDRSNKLIHAIRDAVDADPLAEQN